MNECLTSLSEDEISRHELESTVIYPSSSKSGNVHFVAFQAVVFRQTQPKSQMEIHSWHDS